VRSAFRIERAPEAGIRVSRRMTDSKAIEIARGRATLAQ
jgi:hypothetical protein